MFNDVHNMSLNKLRKVSLNNMLFNNKKIEALTNELNDMNKEFELLVKMNTTTQQDQTIWRKKYAELENIYKNKEVELNSLIEKNNEV